MIVVGTNNMFNMKTLLAGLVLGHLVIAVYASCFGMIKACQPNQREVIDCAECSCNSEGTRMDCCYNFLRPTRVTEGCVVTFDENICEYVVSNPDSPDTECQVFAGVGR